MYPLHFKSDYFYDYLRECIWLCLVGDCIWFSSTELNESYCTIKDDEDCSEDTEDQDATETTLLCPAPRSSEIIITPMTLGSSRDVFSESISLSHFKPDRRNVQEDV